MENKIVLAKYIEEHLEELATEILERQFKKNPRLKQSYSERDMEYAKEDMHHNLRYLIQTIKYKIPNYFIHYLQWLQSVLTSRGQPSTVLKTNISLIQEVLNDWLSGKKKFKQSLKYANKLFDKSMRALNKAPKFDASHITDENPYKHLAQKYLHALLDKTRNEAIQVIMNASEDGVPIKDILLEVIQPVQREVGRLWQINKISVAQEHYCTAISQVAISQLYPKIFTSEKKEHVVVASCISGELHEVGIRMISDLFELSGWNSYFLGANTPIDSLIQILKDKNADVVAISATMMDNIQDVSKIITRIREEKEIEHVKILVGGFSFNINPDLWKRVGADAMAKNAEEALEKAKHLVNKINN